MRKLNLLYFLFLTTSMLALPINIQQLKTVAISNASAIWGEVSAAEPVPYYNLDEQIIAWRFNFAIGAEFPEKTQLAELCRNNYLATNQKNISDGSYGRILMGGTTDLPVVMEYSKCLSQEFAMGWKALELAEERTGKEVKLDKMYYINTPNLWYCYIDGSEKIFVRLFPQKVCKENEFRESVADQKFFCQLEDRSAEWQQYLTGRKTLTRNDYYIEDYELVPYYDWSYGCSPTSATMALAYWDVISTFSYPNYSLLVDYHYQRYDDPEIEWDYQVPNLQRELAVAMDTDSLDEGQTLETYIVPGIDNVTNDQHGYSFDNAIHHGSSLLSFVINETIADRPCLVSEPGHTNCGVGYNSDTNHAAVHNTHDNTIDLVHESGIDAIMTIHPGGGYGEGINLEFPRGDVGYNHNGGGEVLFAGSVYEISWDTDNEYRDQVDIWLSITGNASTINQMLAEGHPNNGYYDWDIPDFYPEYNQARIGIVLYDGYGEKLGQDTSLGNFTITPGGSIPELNEDTSRLNSREPQYYRFYHTLPSWAVVGVRCQTPGDDWDLKLFESTDFETLLTGSHLSEEIPVDLIVVNGNFAPYEERGIKIYRDLGEDQARIEYEGGNNNLSIGTNGPFTWISDDDVVEMWDLPLQPGNYSIILEPAGGLADLDMALFKFDEGTYYGNRQDAIAFSTYLGSEISEFISLDVEEPYVYGLCVWGNDSHSNSYTIRVEQPGTWRGVVSSSWYDEENWSANVIPGMSDDVVIPTGTPYDLRLIDSGVNCHDMVIEYGATVHINNCYLNVYGDLQIRGELEMQTNLAKMICYEDIYWYENSTGDIQDGSAEIWVRGDWYFLENSDVHLDNGYVEFDGDTNSEIICRSPNSYFHHLRSDKDIGHWVANSNNSTYPMIIDGNFFNYADSYFIGWSMNSTIFRGWFNHYPDARFEFANGTCRFEGVNQHIELNSGDYFNDLTIAGSVIMDSNIYIEGDLVIESGELISDSYTIQLKGDWDNQVGFGGFLEYSGIVSFIGYGTQMVNGESFATLKINKPAGELRFHEGISYCDNLLWTQGTLRINGGELTALDYSSSALWYDLIVTSGRLEIHKPTGYLDINNSFTITGGEVHIEGASSSDSYWAYDDDVTFTMSGGVLDYHDTGIRICDEGYDVDETITGGTIRTTGDYRCDRYDFNLDGGTLELYGDADVDLNIINGSHLNNLTINKSPVRRTDDRSGKITRLDRINDTVRTRDRTNTVTAVNMFYMDGDFVLQSGYFVAPTLIWIEGDWNNYAGLDNYLEGTGHVTFRGENNSRINTDENFYTITPDKYVEGSDSVIVASGKTLKVSGYCTVVNGVLKLEEGVNFYLNSAFTVNSVGTAIFSGADDNPVKVSSISGTYEFTVNSGGSIAAEYTEFEDMGSAGINIEDGALIDPDLAFYGCSFRNSDSGGTSLTLDNSQDLLIIEPHFEIDIVRRSHNITKNIDHGSAIIWDPSGNFIGEAHENDPYDRIDWLNRAELFISSVIWSNTTPYGGDLLNCSVTLKNNGLGASSNCFLDLYFNQTEPPGSGQIGDIYYEVFTIEPGDSAVYVFDDISHYTPTVWNSWLQIDTDGNVTEVNETNNLWGPNTITWMPLPPVEDLVFSIGNNNLRDLNLSWSYPISVTRFGLYGEITPYFEPSSANLILETTSNSCPLTDSTARFFYKVIAVRDSTSRIVPSLIRSCRRISSN